MSGPDHGPAGVPGWMASGCRFEGTAAAVQVVGTGEAVLAEPAAFQAGAAARVVLWGATVEGQTSPHEARVVERPRQFEPLGANRADADYEVTYRADGAQVIIQVARGGDDGGIAAGEIAGVTCQRAWCMVEWPMPRKEIRLEPAGDGRVELTGPFPVAHDALDPGWGLPVPAVSRVVVEGGRGDLVCGSRTQVAVIDGQTMTWQAQPGEHLVVAPVAVASGALQVTVSGERAPAVSGAGGFELGGMPVAVGAAVAAVVAVVVGAWAVRAWWRARVRRDVPGRRTAPTAEPANAPAADDPVTPAEGGALATWHKKLAFLELRRAQTASAAQQFELDEQIAEARQKIDELGG